MMIISAKDGNKWEVKIGKYLIGRGSHCAYVINSDAISREHAQLEVFSDGRASLTDLGSRNGTFVNDRALTGPAWLYSGDRVRFAGEEFEVRGIESESPRVAEDGDNSGLVTLPVESLISDINNDIVFAPRSILAISDLGKMLVVPGHEEEIFEKALVLLENLIPFNRAAIFLMADASGLRLVAAKTPEHEAGDFGISQTIVNQISTEKSAVLIRDVAGDFRYNRQDSIIAAGIKSVMAVPLLYDDKVIGLIYADNCRPEISYSEDMLRVVAIFGNILASKTINHDFLTKLQEKEAMEAELAIAAQIQKSLMPQKLPQIIGYNIEAFQAQCQLVGGDLYDISKLEDGRIIFLLADVSGKGMGASLLASNILASFRILYKIKDFDLAEAIESVSDQLQSYSRPGDFATVFAGLLDTESNIFEYVNAGHNSPVFFRRDGEIIRLDSSGIPLGLFGHNSWTRESIAIDRGDCVFAFTDGIPEATNRRSEQFGEERLIKILLEFRNRGMTGLADHINSEMARFLAGPPQSCDDITFFYIARE